MTFCGFQPLCCERECVDTTKINKTGEFSHDLFHCSTIHLDFNLFNNVSSFLYYEKKQFHSFFCSHI